MPSLRGFILVILAASVLLACGERQTLVQLGTQQQILHIGNGSEPAAVDPHITTSLTEYHLQMALFEGLVAKHPKTLEIIPAAADRWEVSDDGLVYRFHIRETAKWSNGEPLTAEDFVLSWHRALMPALGNPYAGSLFVIKNAEAFYQQKLPDFSTVGVTALDTQTLEVVLENPTPYFLQLLDHHSLFPVHIPTLEKHGAIDDSLNPWSRPENFVGNGPFIIKEWTPAKVFAVTPNEHYWDADTVKLKEIRFYPVDQALVEERMFNAGQLHKTATLSAERVPNYRERNAPQYQSHSYLGTYFYLLNVTIKPLDDVRVRKALAYSIDRELIVGNVIKGGQPPAYNFTPPDTLGYTAETKMAYNPDLARQLLAEAGYPNGKGFPRMELSYNTSDSHQKIAVAIQQLWKKELNIDVRLKNQEWKVFIKTQQMMDYQVSRLGWIGDYVDPFTFLEVFMAEAGNNKTGWKNAEYDDLIRLSVKATTREERYAYFQKAEAILVEDVPFLPLYHYTTNYLLSLDVKGYYPNIMDYHPYKYMYLEHSE